MLIVPSHLRCAAIAIVSGDTTAPVLTSAIGTKTGSSTATVGATTDEGNGTLYVVVTTSVTQPSVAQIKAGNDHTGSAAAYASTQTVSSTGARTFSAAGLASSTTFYAHLVHSDAAVNDSNRISSSSFVTDASSSGVFFQANLGAASSIDEVFDRNAYDGGSAALSAAKLRPGGDSKSVLIQYPNDEAGVELHIQNFNTPSLFFRYYINFDTGWATNWPVGLKTCRVFSRTDATTGSQPNAWAYTSFKSAWNGYPGDGPGQGSPDARDDLYSRGSCNAILDLDLFDNYGAGINFGDGNPYLREGSHWYRMEYWMVMNSAVNVSDGIMQQWIDGVQVVNRTNVAYMSTARGVPNGSTWKHMWFGGNYSGASYGSPSVTLKRYEDGHYASTTLDLI